VASIEKRVRGKVTRWRVRWYDEDGSRHERWFPTRKAAGNFSDDLAKMRSTIRRQEGASWTFAELVDEWLQANPNKRPTTLDRDRIVLAKHFTSRLGEKRLTDITPWQVQSAVNAMQKGGLASRTVRTNFGVARAVFQYAVTVDLLERTPCRGIFLPEERDARPRVRVDGPDALHRLADAMDDDYRPAVYLGALGLRQAEVFGLTVGAIDFTRGTLRVGATVNEVSGRRVYGRGKTANSERTLQVPRSVLDLLGRHLQERDRLDPAALVIQAPNGGPVRATNFRNRVWIPACVKADLGTLTKEKATGKRRYSGLTFHRLRHYAIEAMREAGVPLEVASRRVGHASIRTTADVYGSLPESLDRAAASALDDLLASSWGASGGQADDARDAHPL
jgi:integrase